MQRPPERGWNLDRAGGALDRSGPLCGGFGLAPRVGARNVVVVVVIVAADGGRGDRRALVAVDNDHGLARFHVAVST